MSDPRRKPRLAESLLAQEEDLSKSQYEEYRMKLEQRIAEAGRNERRVRTATMVAWVCVLLCPFVMMSVDAGGWAPDFVMFLLGFVYFVGFVCALVFTFLYLLKYRPTLTRSRDERQVAILTELEKKIAELSSRLPPGQ